MQAIQVEDDVARQFRLTEPSALLARRELPRPTATTGPRATGTAGEHTQTAQTGTVFVLLVALAPTEADDIRIEGPHETLPPACPGDTFAFDLATSSVAGFAGPYDLVRLYLPATTLDRLADDQGLPRVRGVHMMPPQVQDPVTQRLALSLLPVLEAPQAGAAQCLDTAALALHAHIVRSDGGTPASRSYTGSGLAPWQLRRVRAFVDDNLDADLSTADLAAACSLSPSHFTRAFSASTGTSPHKWLVNRRIERAKALMLGGGDGLSQIALACGFVDQSHFTRVFARSEGESPGRWRRRNRN
jgi:AraC family transcriptional regulator